MNVSQIGAASAAGAPLAASRPSEVRASFDAVLDGQARRAAARDLLASLPPPVAQQVARSTAGGAPPLPGVHAMFEAVLDGSFVPGERELRAPFWRALDEAARTFESADELWAAAREILGAPAEIAVAVEAAGTVPGPEGAPAGDALRLLGGELPAGQLGWWAWALEFALLDMDAGERG